jgi:hypothetical protein
MAVCFSTMRCMCPVLALTRHKSLSWRYPLLANPYEHRPQLRRGAASARFDTTDGQAQGGHAGELEHGDDVIILPAVSEEEGKGEVSWWLESTTPLSAEVPQPL